MNNRPGHKPRLSNFAIGVIAIVLTVFGFYMAFAKSLPFSSDGYQVKAVFADAQSIRVNSPVRIAGVDVGKVAKVEHLIGDDGEGEDAAVITMNLDDDARPVKEDASLQLRPRLFLEGNLFVDMQPGSPAGEELDSGDVIPLEQTASSVQFDQVLTSLQAPVRADLQVFLKEFGDGLDRYGGGEGFREMFRTSPAAFGATAQVNEALLGTEPGDLAGLIRNLGATVEGLDRNQVQLKDLITNLRIVTGSFASESEALEQGIAELPQVLAVGRPALASLNDSFPALRAFSREALPGVRSANTALDDANPFIGQLRALVSKKEARGLVKDLRPTIPQLASLAKASVPFFEETRALSSCFNNVIIPWADTDVPEAPNASPAVEVYKETGYSLAGVAGESRTGDANGQALRVLGGGGTLSFSFPDIDLGSAGGTQTLAGVTPFELIGAQPAKQTSAKTPFRPDAPCENQDPPDLNTGAVPDPPEMASARSASAPIPGTEGVREQYAELMSQLLEVDELTEQGRTKEAATLRKTVQAQIKSFLKTEVPDFQDAVAEFTGRPAGGGN